MGLPHAGLYFSFGICGVQWMYGPGQWCLSQCPAQGGELPPYPVRDELHVAETQ